MVQIFGHLTKQVPLSRFCPNCNYYIASCPFDSLKMTDAGLKLTGKCTDCGICYNECPQVVNSKELQKQVFGTDAVDKSIGRFKQAFSIEARNADIKKRAQDGGAVTSILASLLEEGFIDGAVVMGVGDSPWKPVPQVATTREELIKCAGSKYSMGSIFSGLRDAVNLYGLSRVALVGTPCQIAAARRMQFSRITNRRLGEAIKLRVGLFCWGAFDYKKFFVNVIEKQMHTPLGEVVKFDIKRGRFIAYRGKKPRRELVLGAAEQYMYLPCRLCSDFSAELADISVGATGSPLGRSTVLIRTRVGSEAFDVVRGFRGLDVLELEKVKPGIEAVKKASRGKKLKAARELERLKRQGKPLPIWMQEQPPAPKDEELLRSTTRVGKL